MIGNQVGSEACGLVVLRHNDGNNLAIAAHRHLNLERRKTSHVVAVRGRFNGCIFALVAAIDCSCFGKNRILIASMRLNAERGLRVGQHLLHRVHKRAGRNGRASDGIHIAAQRVRIGRNRNELLLESIVTYAAAKALRLLK